MVPILEHQGPARPWNNRSFERTMAKARDGHGTTSFCVVWCQTTPWHGVAGMASTLLCTNARNSRLRPCFAEKSQIVTKNTQSRTVDCAPSNFVRSVLPS